MKGVVLDCNVVLQGLLRKSSPAFACLEKIECDGYRIQLSLEVTDEYREVLTRDKLRRKFPILTPAFVEERLQYLVAHSDYVEKVQRVYEYLRDPDDERYINLAIVTKAVCLVSRDLDLLVLTNDELFRTSYPDLMICDPVEFLKLSKQ